MFAAASRPSASPTRSRGVLRTLAVVSFTTVAATAIAGTAQAAPATPAPVKVQISSTSSDLKISVANGTISTKDGTLSIRNTVGKELYRMPLAYRMEYRQFPIDAKTVGSTATLTPSKNPARSVAVSRSEVDPLRVQAAKQSDPDAPKTRKQRDDRALNQFTQTLSIGMTVSQLVGLIVGAVGGGIIGCILTIFAACTGVVAGAGLGGVIGLVLGGGGTLIYAAVQYFQTINSPFKAPE
ncbi:glycine zipper family protein [Gordonia sp. OPL2]|nr:glycine zipper family protein [Gordonia sp. OPL2]